MNVLIVIAVIEVFVGIVLLVTSLNLIDAKASFELFREQLENSKRTNEYFLHLWETYWKETHEDYK